MRESPILSKDRESSIRLYKKMKPEERLIAFFHHSRLMNQIYQAGMRYRAGRSSPSKRKPC